MSRELIDFTSSFSLNIQVSFALLAKKYALRDEDKRVEIVLTMMADVISYRLGLVASLA